MNGIQFIFHNVGLFRGLQLSSYCYHSTGGAPNKHKLILVEQSVNFRADDAWGGTEPEVALFLDLSFIICLSWISLYRKIPSRLVSTCSLQGSCPSFLTLLWSNKPACYKWGRLPWSEGWTKICSANAVSDFSVLPGWTALDFSLPPCTEALLGLWDKWSAELLPPSSLVIWLHLSILSEPLLLTAPDLVGGPGLHLCSLPVGLTHAWLFQTPAVDHTQIHLSSVTHVHLSGSRHPMASLFLHMEICKHCLDIQVCSQMTFLWCSSVPSVPCYGLYSISQNAYADTLFAMWLYFEMGLVTKQ